MTKQKKLKRAARARARKTGESYAAARAQVVKAKEPPPPPIPKRAAGTVTDEATRVKTGEGLGHWFRVLDRFGAKQKGHTASARHLRDDHGVSSWYSQGITVAYERAHGLREENQAGTGDYQVSVSRVLPTSVADTAKALRSKKARASWLADADRELRTALERALAKKGALRVRDDRARLRFRWSGALVELYLDAKPDGRSTLVAQTSKLGGKPEVEQHRARWKTVLDALRAHLRSTTG